MSADGASAAAPTHRVRKDRNPPTPRSTLTLFQYKWERLNCEWWETDEEADEGPNKGKYCVKYAVTEQFLSSELTDAFEAQFNDEGDARCDRDRYGCATTAPSHR